MSAFTRFELLLLLVLGVTLLLARPLGAYMERILDGAPRGFLGRLEQALYRLCGINAGEMPWQRYALALLSFDLVGALLVYGLQRLQGFLPFNPEHLSAPSADTAFNTAIAFVTNTDWQSYTGETTLGYTAQMAA